MFLHRFEMSGLGYVTTIISCIAISMLDNESSFDICISLFLWLGRVYHEAEFVELTGCGLDGRILNFGRLAVSFSLIRAAFHRRVAMEVNLGCVGFRFVCGRLRLITIIVSAYQRCLSI